MPSALNDQRVPWDSLLGVNEGYSGLSDMPYEAGYLAWTYDPQLANAASSAFTSAKLQVVRVKIPAPITVTSIQYVITTAAVGGTSGQNFVGLYNGNLTLVGASADQTTAWGSTGLTTSALVGGPFTISTPYAYVAFQVNAATSGPALARMTAPSTGVVFSNTNLIPNPFRHGQSTGAAGTTSMPTPLPALTQGTVNPWVALI